MCDSEVLGPAQQRDLPDRVVGAYESHSDDHQGAEIRPKNTAIKVPHGGRHRAFDTQEVVRVIRIILALDWLHRGNNIGRSDFRLGYRQQRDIVRAGEGFLRNGNRTVSSRTGPHGIGQSTRRSDHIPLVIR